MFVKTIEYFIRPIVEHAVRFCYRERRLDGIENDWYFWGDSYAAMLINGDDPAKPEQALWRHIAATGEKEFGLKPLEQFTLVKMKIVPA